MIEYNSMTESWFDTEDFNFEVSMTPEGYNEYDITFENQEEFWRWCNNEQ